MTRTPDDVNPAPPSSLAARPRQRGDAVTPYRRRRPSSFYVGGLTAENTQLRQMKAQLLDDLERVQADLYRAEAQIAELDVRLKQEKQVSRHWREAAVRAGVEPR